MPGALTRIAELGLLGLLAFAPLVFGGNREVARYVLRVGPVLLLGLAWYAASRTPPAPALRTAKETRFPPASLVPFAVYAAVLLVQVLPLPVSVLGMLSASRAEAARLVPGSPSWGTISLYPQATAEALLDWLAALAAMGLAYAVVDSRGAARRFGWSLVLSGAFQALYGAFEFLSGRQTIFGYRKIHYLDCATGTFINRNHYAAYLALCLGVSWGLLAYDLFSPRNDAGAGRRRERAALLFVLAALIGIGVVLSGSRGGMLAIALALAATQIALPRAGTRGRAAVVALVFALVVGASVWWIGRAPLAERAGEIAADLPTANQRTVAWTATARMIADAPVLGGGGETYRWRYPRFGASGRTNFDHAHDEYLEVAADTGLVGAAAFVAGFAVLVGFVVRRARERSSRFARRVTSGGLLAVAALLVHALYDFPLRMPGVAFTFFAVLGFTLATANRRLE
jgi:O-antigen ligase